MALCIWTLIMEDVTGIYVELGENVISCTYVER